MTGSLPKRYARALFELARESDTLVAFGEELGRAAAAFQEPRLQRLLLTPALPQATRRKTARAVVSALQVSAMVGNLVLLLAERERLAIVPDVARWYDELIDQELGRARVLIRSAVPMSAAERTALLDLARRLTRRREVIASTEVDPELLGGVVVDTGGTVYDGSVRTQLVRLSKEMAERGA